MKSISHREHRGHREIIVFNRQDKEKAKFICILLPLLLLHEQNLLLLL